MTNDYKSITMTDERFSFLVALYAVCEAFHSGKSSRGYRILSRITTAYNPRNLPSLNTIRQGKRGEYSDIFEHTVNLMKYTKEL